MAQIRHTTYAMIPIRKETAQMFRALVKKTGLYNTDFLLLLMEKYRVSKLNKK